MSDTTDTLTPWQQASLLLNHAWAELRRAADTLPTVGDDRKCTACGCDDEWEVQEEGYVRGWSVVTEYEEYDDDDNGIGTPTWTACYSGSEDWSDEGDGPTVLVCTNFYSDDTGHTYCGTAHQLPDDLEWN